MASVRKSLGNERHVQAKVTQLLDKPKGVVAHALGSVHRGGEYLNVGPAASTEDIDGLLKCINCVLSPEFVTAGASKATMDRDEPLQRFVGHCCRFSLYAMQIKKCGDPDCTVPGCGKTKLPTDEFNRRVHWLPLPMKNPEGGWYAFEDLYGKRDTTDADLPSRLAKEGSKEQAAIDKSNKACYMAR